MAVQGSKGCGQPSLEEARPAEKDEDVILLLHSWLAMPLPPEQGSGHCRKARH